MVKSDDKLNIPYPPDETFEHKSAGAQMLNQNQVTHILDHIEYTKDRGINVYIVDAKYPKKGWPYPEAVWAINIVKKIVVEALRLLLEKQMLGWTVTFTLALKSKVKLLERVLDSYNVIALNVISPHIVKFDYMTPTSKQTEAVVYTFLDSLGVGKDNGGSTTLSTAKVIGTIVEYDDAYRYMLQDIMGETTKEKLLQHPRKEILRLLDILATRTHAVKLKDNIKNLRRLIKVLFLSRKIKKAFNETVIQMDLKALQPDDADSYWMDMREDYDYKGIPYSDRKDVVLLKGYKINV